MNRASRIPARVRRMTSDNLKSARLIAGRTKCDSPSRVNRLNWRPRKGTVSPLPVAGSQSSSTAKIIMNISPTQKLGRLKPRMEPPMISLPLTEWGLSPAHMPSGMPNTMAMNMAENASSMVAGMRSKIKWIAGMPALNETPSSPLSAFFTKTKYCSCNGR